MLFGVGAGDPLTLAVVTVVLGMVAMLACLAPARRATAVDPVIAFAV
jgi:ABC-type lipoprotein release transport system permease subunit